MMEIAVKPFSREKDKIKRLNETLLRFRTSQSGKAAWQLVNTLVPYVLLWALMIYLFHRGAAFWQVLPLTLLAGGFLVRNFIAFHDCCHGSFFPSRRANKITGYFTGLLTFTSYYKWRHDHLLHHANSGNLDQRGTGDIWTMTVEEYRSASFRQKLGYRLYRNPLVLFLLGPFYLFLIAQRFPSAGASKKERRSVLQTNLGIAAILLVAGFTIGLKTYLLIQLPILLFGGAAGVWLFYVQHQYEEVYWARQEDWDVVRASLEGSSYYKLPKILQWFTGNIGLHHIHHLESRIPNYRLQECQDQVPLFRKVKPLTLRKSINSLRFSLWDEKRGRMTGFHALRNNPE